MKILAFDTSFSNCSIALLSDNKVKTLEKIAPKQQAKLILPMIKELLDSAHVQLNQLDAIAFGCGPGSFTGIRIATSVAQGIAFGLNLPVIPVSSLAILAQSAYLDKKWSNLLVAVDARMDQVYWALYQVNSQGLVELWRKEELCFKEEVSIPEAVGQDWYGVGDGWEKYAMMLIKQLNFSPKAIDSSLFPRAESLLQLAQAKWMKGEWVTPPLALPHYLR